MSECDCPQCSGLAVHYTEVGGVTEPTTQDLLLLEVLDLVASAGELRISLDAMWRQVVRQQEQINELAEDVKTLRAGWINDAGRSANIDAKITKELKELWKLGMEHDRRLSALEANSIDIDRPWAMTGTIEGLEGEFTVTPPPEFEAA